MLKIYGPKQSRAARCMWVMEELGLQYEQVPYAVRSADTQTPAYLALNPAGKVPTLDHDGFVLTETFAINFYLASTFPGNLLPKDAKSLAKVHQWTSWALSELEPAVMAILVEGRRPAELIDKSRIDAARASAQTMIEKVLEPQLARSEYLIAGNGFTLADLNVSAVAGLAAAFQISLANAPKTAAWVQRCTSRDAYKRAQARA